MLDVYLNNNCMNKGISVLQILLYDATQHNSCYILTAVNEVLSHVVFILDNKIIFLY